MFLIHPRPEQKPQMWYWHRLLLLLPGWLLYPLPVLPELHLILLRFHTVQPVLLHPLLCKHMSGPGLPALLIPVR